MTSPVQNNSRIAPTTSVPTTSSTMSDRSDSISVAVLRRLADSRQASTVIFCRICQENDDTKEPLITPCYCSGSIGYLHASCLEKWLLISNHKRCEICNFTYIVEMRLKYRMLPSICIWIREEADRRHLIFDAICITIAGPLVACGVYFCVTTANYVKAQSPKYTPSNVTAPGLMLLCVTIILAYIAWCFAAFRYHRRCWRKWWKGCLVIKVMSRDNIPRRGQPIQIPQPQAPHPPGLLLAPRIPIQSQIRNLP